MFMKDQQKKYFSIRKFLIIALLVSLVAAALVSGLTACETCSG